MTRLENRRTVSYDGGITWSAPEPLNDNINNCWTGNIIVSRTRWLMPVSYCTAAGGSCDDKSDMIKWAKSNFDFKCRVLYSDDNGASFKMGAEIPSPEKHLIEPRLVELPDGRLMMLIRSMDSAELFRSYSSDNGISWSEAERSGIPNPSAKILLLKTPGNKVVLVHNPTTPRRSRLELWCGDGDTWESKLLIATDTRRNLNYPDGFFDDNGDLRLIWEDARSIFTVTIPEEKF